MNNLFTKNNAKINRFFAAALLTPVLLVLSTALLSIFSNNAFANRPAMDEPNTTTVETSNQAPRQGEQEQVELQSRPETKVEVDAPSAVEVMMQQQNQQPQQTTGALQLPAKEMQPGETLKIQFVDFPRRGMSMERVQQEYGQPLSASESVGQPPITHWIYNDRVVYFEYSTVLHVVAR